MSTEGVQDDGRRRPQAVGRPKPPPQTPNVFTAGSATWPPPTITERPAMKRRVTGGSDQCRCSRPPTRAVERRGQDERGVSPPGRLRSFATTVRGGETRVGHAAPPPSHALVRRLVEPFRRVPQPTDRRTRPFSSARGRLWRISAAAPGVA